MLMWTRAREKKEADMKELAMEIEKYDKAVEIATSPLLTPNSHCPTPPPSPPPPSLNNSDEFKNESEKSVR